MIGDSAEPAGSNADPTVGKREAAAVDWRACWYPATFLEDLPADRPVRITLWDEGLVLFRDQEGRPVCLTDRCPHRAARLSDGQLVDGRLECLYHGWQFDGSGACVHIPQLLPERQIPERACTRAWPAEVVAGIVWIWAGDPSAADPAAIPRTPGADGPDVAAVTFQMDLPYDQSYLIENVIDVAHIHIAHHGVRGGGLREAARPLEFEPSESTVAGFSSRFRSVGLKRAAGSPQLRGALVEFVAPNLIRYRSDYADGDLVAGLELYSLPMGKGRCRLLYRKYSNFTSWRERIKPRWVEHLTQMTILEQDMNVVVGQHEEIEGAGCAVRDLWLPLRSSDRLVIEYRRWLDRFGGGLPFYRGFSTAKDSAPVRAGQTDRHSLHTGVCAACGRLHARLGQVRVAGLTLAALAGAAGVATGGSVAAALLVLAGLGAAASATWLRARF
jgi:phenylpropionate dioxygenase-like ring-hydroxylating dioxygenase large terminal subunit